MARTRFPDRQRPDRRDVWDPGVFVPDPPARPDDGGQEDHEPEGERFTTADGRTLRRVVIEP